MDKKIQKKKTELEESKLERAIRKQKYDTQMLMLEGQRRTTLQMEEQNSTLLEEYNQVHNKVNDLLKELQELTTQQELQETKTE